MSSDWTKISEKIISFYEEMEYHPEYNIEQFRRDFEIERSKNVSVPAPRSDVPTQKDVSGILQFRDVLESRRSILTKLFSLTNNLNGVDTLIEYCDYYKSYYNRIERNCFRERFLYVYHFFYTVFAMLGKNEITQKELFNVWKMLYIDNLRWRDVPNDISLSNCWYKGSCSVAMVIMADSDLNAVVHALIGSHETHFQVFRVLVQEPVKEQLLSTMKKYECKFEILSILYVFRNTAEALANLYVDEKKLTCMSVWSENIIAAKKFSANAEIDTIWINAHGVLGAGLDSIMDKRRPRDLDVLLSINVEDDDSPETPPPFPRSVRTYDLFYGGKWQRPANKEYWTDKAGISFAQASKSDFNNCANSARSAFKQWRSKGLSQRIKIIRCFAERLEANGESEYADIILQFVNRPLEFGNSFSIVRDGEAEILTTPEPVGVVMIGLEDLKTLYERLTIASVTGNAVIVLLDSKNFAACAPYFDLLGSCGFPPGVINFMFINALQTEMCFLSSIDAIPLNWSNIRNKGSKSKSENLCNDFFLAVTKPKSVWLQCR